MPGQDPDDVASPDERGIDSTVDGPTRTTTGTPLPAEAAPAARRWSLAQRDSSRYQVVAEHGRGGLGRVMRAHDRDLARDVAIKEILSSEGLAEARFIREAMITARLEHPGIVPVHDAGRWQDGTPFYAMKLVAGRPLKEVIQGTASLEDRLALLPHVIAVAEAIAYAHSRSIIHRDLKPSNIIVGDFGETIVIDWGLAKDLNDGAPSEADEGIASSDPAVTRAGAILGTPAYMPPEQARGGEVTTAADIYALGAVLYHVLTGAPPHTSDASAESRAPVPLTTRTPEVPEELSAIVVKAMRAEPSERYETAEQLVDDLRRYQTGNLVTAHKYGAAALLWRWVVRYRLPVAAFIVLLAAVMGLWQVNRRIRMQERAERVAEQDARQSARALKEAQLHQFQELGRLALLGGDPLSALPYLSAVYSEGIDTKALRLLISDALGRLPLVTIAHSDAVTSAELDPEAKIGVSCGRDGYIKVWRTADNAAGQLLANWSMGAGPIWDCRLSPDGRRIVVGNGKGEAAVFMVGDTGNPVRWQADAQWVYAVAWTPDGQRVATAGAGGRVRLWNPDTGALLADLEGPGKQLRGLQISADGSHLVAWNIDAGVVPQVWDLRANYRPSHLARVESGVIFHAALSPTGTRVVGIDYNGWASVWDTATGRLLCSIKPSDYRRGSGADFSPDGRRFVMSAQNGVFEWNSDTCEKQLAFQSAASPIVGFRYSPDGTKVASFGSDGWARVFDVSTGAVIDEFRGHSGELAVGRWSADSRWLVTSASDGLVCVWETGRTRPRGFLSMPMVVPRMALGLISGDKLITNRDIVEVWNLRDGHRIGAIETGLSQVVDMSASSNGRRLALAGEDGAIVIVDLNTLTTVHRLPARGEVWAVALDADGGRVATVAGPRGEGVTVRSTSDDVTIFQQRGVRGYLEKIQYSPGAETIAVVSGDSVIQFLSPSDGTVLRSFDGQSVAFDAAGKVMVTTDAHGRNVAELTDVTSGKAIATMDGRAGLVTTAELSPDAALVVSGTIEGVIAVWDASTGTMVKVLQADSDSPATCTRFDPAGEIVLGCTLDGAIRTWRLPHSTPTPEAVDAIVRCRVPLRLEGGRLVRAEPDLAACSRIPTGALGPQSGNH